MAGSSMTGVSMTGVSMTEYLVVTMGLIVIFMFVFTNDLSERGVGSIFGAVNTHQDNYQEALASPE